MSRKRRRRRYTPVERRLSNEIFDARPQEIFALRKAVGWTRLEFASFCGVFCDTRRDDSPTVRRWETGRARPHAVHRWKLVHLSELFRDPYLEKLNAIRSGAIRYQVDKSIRSEDRKSSGATNPFSLSS